MAVMAVPEQISPELVLVDPELAALERPRERALSVPAAQVVPLGVPLVPREGRAWPAWLVVALGLCLLAGGLFVSMLLFRGPSGGQNAPTTAIVPRTATAPAPGDTFAGPPIPNP